MKRRMRCKQGEIFKPVYPNYMLSNLGRWWSISAHKILSQHKNSSGYLRVSLYLNGCKKWVFTHIKVVEIFGDCKGSKIPNGYTSLLSNGLSIDHLNKKRTDPRQCNLELTTHSINCQRKYKKEV